MAERWAHPNPLPGASHQDQGEDSNDYENPDKEWVAGYCDAASALVCTDQRGNVYCLSNHSSNLSDAS